MQVFTNSYTVGFGDINRGLNLRSEFLDTKWRALLAEIDLSYRQRDGTSDLGFDLDRDLTMCDWRSSFSDGSKMHAFPVAWPIKPAHAAEFYLANTLDHAAEYTGQISAASWVAWNSLYWPNSQHEAFGESVIPAPDDMRWHLVDRAWQALADAKLAAGEDPPTGFEVCDLPLYLLGNHAKVSCVCRASGAQTCSSDEWCGGDDSWPWGKCRDVRAQEYRAETGCAPCASAFAASVAD